ncbi:pilin [Enterovibrio sp. ZSDZ35]|uniref:Pilin n=1 Tax=Enterovibrio qingdaonensis TaxID=2899818 RepID=A0ABT5QMS8_9GAMM|nr:pilin [Enterovibrio sp. ZSDZ35]
MKSVLTNLDLYLQENEFPTDSKTNWDAIGAASDMTSLGTLVLAQITTGEGEAAEVSGGTVTLTFNEKTSIDTKKIQFEKSASGWKCVQDTGVTDLKSCAPGTPK